MNLIKKNSKECVKLADFLQSCPNYQCLDHPSSSLDLDNLYQLTSSCFNQLNHTFKVKRLQSRKSIAEQRGGGDVSGPGPQPSGAIYDGTPISNVKDLYINVRKYMELHKISQLTEKTMIPYGIILSTLNIPNDLIVLNQIYPHIVSYLSKKQLTDNLHFETLLPIGLFVNETDMHNINHLKLNI